MSNETKLKKKEKFFNEEVEEEAVEPIL